MIDDVLQGTKSMNRKGARNGMGTKALAVAAGALALAIGLFSAVPASYADSGSDQATHWGHWRALSGGFVGRRRVPANIDLPVAERRQSHVTARSDFVQRLQRRFNRQHGGSRRGGQLSTFNALSAQVSQSGFGLGGGSRRFGNRADAVWLKTGDAGLYAVSIADVASQLNQNEGQVRRLAERGRLAMTNAGHPVSWYYDQSGDQILFAGELYNTFYTDQNAYHLEIGHGRGAHAQSMTVSRGRPPRGTGSSTPFPDSIHFEQEPDFRYAVYAVGNDENADYWFWDYLFGSYKDQIQVALDIPDPAPSGQAELRIHLRGFTAGPQANEHQVYAELNGVQIGSPVTWEGFGTADIVADVDLDPSGNNTLTLHTVYSPGTHPGEFLNSIDLDYSRQPVAKDGMLWLHDAAGGRQVVSGFSSSDISVIESPTGNAVLRNDIRVDGDGSGAYMVTFDAQNGDDYLVVERDAFDRATVDVDYPSDLSSPRNAADYLIIAPRVFAGTAEALAKYRQNRFGNVKIAWLDDIYDEFSDGRVDPFAITRFMDTVRNDWQLSPPYMVLIGNGTFDEKDRMGYSDSFLPIVLASTPWGLAPSDERLLTGDEVAKLNIGRIPITNDAQGIDYVNKLIAYESSAPGSERDAVLVADNPDDGGDFYASSDSLADRLTGSLGFNNVTKLYYHQPLGELVRPTLTMSTTWNKGYISYDGHGAAAQFADEDFFNSTDAGNLQNTTYPVFTGWTCQVGNFAQPGLASVAGALVLNSGGGAIASLAATGLSLDSEANLLAGPFVEGLFGSYYTIGEAAKQAKVQIEGQVDPSMPRIYSILGDPAIEAR